MAFTNVIRRSASGIIPSAIRAMGSQRCYHHKSCFSTAPITHPIALSQNLFPISSFSTATQRKHARKLNRNQQKPSTREANHSLVKAIDSELHWVGDSDDNDKVEDVPQSFPFKIKAEPKKQIVTFTSDDQDECITVEVNMTKPTKGEETGDSEPMVVRVAEKSFGYSIFGCVGPCLEFGVSAYPDKIEIKTLSFMDDQSDKDGNKIDDLVRADFMESDENLQKALHKYLNSRGINHRSTNLVLEYMMNKESRDYVGMLKGIKRMVESY